jgi:hypothetical protein
MEGSCECTAMNLVPGQGLPVAKEDDRWLPTVAARVRTRIRPNGICGGQGGIWALFSEYICFSYQSFHWLLHINHHPSSSEAGTIGQIVADVPSGHSLTSREETKNRPSAYAIDWIGNSIAVFSKSCLVIAPKAVDSSAFVFQGFYPLWMALTPQPSERQAILKSTIRGPVCRVMKLRLGPKQDFFFTRGCRFVDVGHPL